MIDWIRNLTKSAAEKQQEMLTAYVDDELSATERRRFEQLMTQDESLRAEVERQRLFKQAIRALPRIEAPRNFILNKGEFQAPAPQRAIQLYPVLRTATAMAAIFLAVVVVAGLFTQPTAFEAATDIAFATIPAQLSEDNAAASQAEEADADSNMGMAEAELVETEAETIVEESAADEASAAEAPQDDGADADMEVEEEMADEEEFLPESTASSPRPGETAEEIPRADESVVEPTIPVEIAIAPTETPETVQERVTIPDGGSEAPVDIPWLSLIAITLFIVLLVATLLVRRQKNSF